MNVASVALKVNEVQNTLIFYNILEFMALRLRVLMLGWRPSSHLANMNYFFKNFFYSTRYSADKL